jgi:hypothetical protein
MNAKCEELIKNTNKSKWLRIEIKKYEKIKNRTPAEQWQLCNLRATVTDIPFTSTNKIYALCSECEHGLLFLRGVGLFEKKQRAGQTTLFSF